MGLFTRLITGLKRLAQKVLLGTLKNEKETKNRVSPPKFDGNTNSETTINRNLSHLFQENPNPKNIEEDIDSSFDGIKILKLKVEDREVPIISLNTLPMSFAIRMASTPDPHKQIEMMSEYMRMCLVNPSDWFDIEKLTLPAFSELVMFWIENSADE